MPAPRKPALPTIDPHRLALVQTVLLAAAYDQIAERSGAPGSDLVLAEAGVSHTEIAAATGRKRRGRPEHHPAHAQEGAELTA